MNTTTTMTLRHDIMTDQESGQYTSQCISASKQTIYFYKLNTN